ncbi:MAG TPA: hypothetical protein VFG10_00700 [Saprospiraceae bacterium]|nr:hypothetical protein [Saprospiraceae bacterium]
MTLSVKQPVFICLFLLNILACKDKSNNPTSDSINAIDLKRGDIVLCGSGENQFGNVVFETSCSDLVKTNFNLAMALLHSFEYDEAEKVFAKVIDAQNDCAMAYWGVAMANFHPLWTPPTQAELEKGAKAIAIAQSLNNKSKRESDYIDAIGVFYKDWNTTTHLSRSLKFEKAMEKLHADNPEDKEAAIFYALALDGASDPTDKTYSKQKKAGELLHTAYANEASHPGIIHYIIHSYDSPELAQQALAEARKYASIAPSSAHAQHMPSHIFTRLGLWDESITSNLQSIDAAKCYAENTGMAGHYDEEFHAMDYLVYAYLQKGQNELAKERAEELKGLDKLNVINFKEAYSFAAIPARYVLENKMWKEASTLKAYPENFPWEKFPWQNAIIHFTRLLGFVHLDNNASALDELNNLIALSDTLTKQKDNYKANQVQIQIKAGEAWILFKEGRMKEALDLMKQAAVMEEKTQKHPVTPGEVVPARELLGDMLAEMGQYEKALESYEADLKDHPNRFNGLYGAGAAAEKMHDIVKAKKYYEQLISITDPKTSKRTELDHVRKFLARSE